VQVHPFSKVADLLRANLAFWALGERSGGHRNMTFVLQLDGYNLYLSAEFC
jgi:hypothetical protein